VGEWRSRRGLARRIARNFGRVVTEFLYLSRLGPGDLSEVVDIESFEPLKQYADGPGAVFATAHLGNWELAGAVLSMLGIDLTVIVYDDPDPRVARLFRERREAKGVRVVPVKATAKELTAAVRDTSLGVVADRDFSGRGMAATFFGADVRMPFAYAGLAVSRGMPVVFGVCVKLDDGKYHLMAEEPVYGDRSDPGSSRKVAEQCIHSIEKYVEKYPEQWYLFEKIGGELT
jgi:KDO2-lipid IV(A) lauroyltransferase